MMTARPTVASAAATTITKKTNNCPSRFPKYREKPMKAKLTALSISSMHMKTVMMFFRKTNPAAPITKRVTLRANTCASGTILETSELLLGQDHGAQNCHQDQDGGDLERQHVIPE